jgi:ferritin-like metal-binding protein YciE
MDVQVDYATLVEVMTEKLSTQLSQIVALEARIKCHEKKLQETLDNVSELQKALDNASKKSPSTRKKTVDTVKDGGEF